MPVRFRPLLALGALVLALTLAAPAVAQNAPTLGAPETQTRHRRAAAGDDRQRQAAA